MYNKVGTNFIVSKEKLIIKAKSENSEIINVNLEEEYSDKITLTNMNRANPFAIVAEDSPIITLIEN